MTNAGPGRTLPSSSSSSFPDDEEFVDGEDGLSGSGLGVGVGVGSAVGVGVGVSAVGVGVGVSGKVTVSVSESTAWLKTSPIMTSVRVKPSPASSNAFCNDVISAVLSMASMAAAMLLPNVAAADASLANIVMT